MSIERVQRFLAEHAPETTVTVLAKNTATVALAAEAFGVESGQTGIMTRYLDRGTAQRHSRVRLRQRSLRPVAPAH